MSNIVLIGAGQTGRGYLNRFFKDEKVTFLDIDSELIERLQQEKKYNIFFGKQRETLTLDNFKAYTVDSKQGLDALAQADLVMISVGQKNLDSLVPLIQKALAIRQKGDVDILTAENGVHTKNYLIPLCQDKRVHLAETIVFCTTLKQKNSLDVFSEDLDYLPYDVVSLGHQLPYKHTVAEKNLSSLMQRKIYTYNCLSAVVTYLGYYKGYEEYAKAANDPEITMCMDNILQKLNACICKEYEIDVDEQAKFSQMAVAKFQNKAIVDTIERNARDVDRKLGENERILAPLCILKKYGKQSDELLLVAACAVYYGQKTSTLLKSFEKYFEILPKEWFTQIVDYLKKLDNQMTIIEVLSV